MGRFGHRETIVETACSDIYGVQGVVKVVKKRRVEAGSGVYEEDWGFGEIGYAASAQQHHWILVM